MNGGFGQDQSQNNIETHRLSRASREPASGAEGTGKVERFEPRE